MANALFDKGREGFLGGDIDWDANNIKLVCVDHADDTPVVATDDFLDDIGAAARVATSGNFANKTKTAGVADADDITLTSVTGDQFESIVIYNDTPATEAGKHLIAYIDSATGLPCTPNGGNINIVFDSGANKIFKL
jgi:hypothetical protein